MTEVVIPETKIDHLSFYLDNGISPVRQHIEDLEKHMQRRSSLYQQLGLPAMLLNRARVLEVGPGSGHNSLYVASCKPQEYDLLEPNKRAQQEINNLYSDVPVKLHKPNLIKNKLEEFQSEKKYDIVICEAWLGVSKHERAMMRKLASLVKKGGVLVTTIGSPVGSVANAVRRVLSWAIIDVDQNIHHNTKNLLRAFTPHLKTIKDMSTLHEDWVQDSLMNPGFITMCPSPDMFIEDIGDEFDIYQTYPKFTSEWRFYKSLYGESKMLNKKFLDSYYKNIHNFFDYLEVLPEVEKEINLSLEQKSFRLMYTIAKKEDAKDTIIDDELRHLITAIFSQLISINNSWSKPLEEVIELLSKQSISISDISTLKFYNKIFGRELTYASAVRK